MTEDRRNKVISHYSKKYKLPNSSYPIQVTFQKFVLRIKENIPLETGGQGKGKGERMWPDSGVTLVPMALTVSIDVI